jgi:hypothetical protein
MTLILLVILTYLLLLAIASGLGILFTFILIKIFHVDKF